MSWTPEIENHMLDIQKSCSNYKFLNIKAAQKKIRSHNILMYSSMLVSSVVGILSTFNTNSIVSVFITIFSFFAGILSAIVKFSKYESKAATHQNLYYKFTNLENLIKKELSLPISERTVATQFLNFIHTSLINLIKISPIILDEDYRKWVETDIVGKKNLHESVDKTVENDKDKLDKDKLAIKDKQEEQENKDKLDIKDKQEEQENKDNSHNSQIKIDMALLEYEMGRLHK